MTSVQAYVCVKKVLVLLLYPCLLGFNCDCNFKFRYCNQPFYINGLWLFKFGKIDYFGKCQCFWCVALIFIQLIFAYGLLKKKPNFILIWILGEAQCFEMLLSYSYLYHKHIYVKFFWTIFRKKSLCKLMFIIRQT